ncbi:glycosyltransferase family 4 protein, partial [Falsiroseomonas oryzae]|uniref:glycosyltransferase family 4 protein n=1 Tax=Falsiroseomonas oryzae TaxID=2766473 RepID=UPI0022EA9A18
CDPGDAASIRRAVQEAWETRRDPAAVARQQQMIARAFGWDAHREATEEVYAAALDAARARGATPPRALPAPSRPAEWRTQRIVMDVTTTANHKGRWTGIARVEAQLAHALQADPRAEVTFVAWNAPARAFVEVPYGAIASGDLPAWLAQQAGATEPALPAGAPLLVAGSAWMQNGLYAESVVSFARRHALRLTPLIHDVIPTRFPWWFDEGYAPVFEHNLAVLLDGAEALLAVSDATRREVAAFAARTSDLFIPDIAVLREGDGIGLPGGQAEDDSVERIATRFAGKPFVLSVGAIHARKNHRLLHDVWLKLAERMGERCPHLVLVGGVAWNGAEVARALRGDPRLAGRVHILEDVDDAALGWLYRTCLFTAYPSLQEGWGLPVAESLAHGKVCLAADTSSIPEIAPGLVEALDPLDVMQWVTRVQFLAGSRAARAAAEARIAREYRGFSWAQSAEMLLDLLAEAAERPRPKRPYTPGAVANLADRIPASRLRGAGWHAVEDWGCWTAATSAELVFEPSMPIGEAAVFLAEARALPLPDRPCVARILANGAPIGLWRLRTGEPQLLHAVIPAEVAARAATLRIGIQTEALVAAGEVSGTDDPRLVGLGLSQAALVPLSAARDHARWFAPQGAAPRGLRLGARHDLLADAA